MELKKDKSSKGFRTKVLKFIPQQKIFVLCFSTNKRLHSHDQKQWKMNENHQKSTFFIICMRGACRNKKNKYVYWLLFGVELMHCKKLYVDGFFKTCTMFQSTHIVLFHQYLLLDRKTVKFKMCLLRRMNMVEKLSALVHNHKLFLKSLW